MAWTTFRLRVLTPLFSGDDPQGPALVRVPSVRGALRFWLRAVAAGRGGLVGPADVQDLWEVEEGVLGSTRVTSGVGLRIRRQPETSTETHPGWTRTTRPPSFDGAHYLLGQGLWHHRDGLSRPFVPAGAEFSLDVRFSGDAVIDGRFMIALWAWLTYGGLGARVRRGFGQLGCVGVDGDLPSGWTAGSLARPSGESGWLTLADAVFPPVAPWTGVDAWQGLPTGSAAEVAEHPALAARWWEATLVPLDVTEMGPALHQTGLDWRLFRAGPGALTDANGLPFSQTRSPEWTGVVHGDGTRYPLAALGLPTNYFSTHGATPYSASVAPTLGGEELRRASPVWLRPVRLRDGTWRLFTHVFLSRLLPEDAELSLRPRRGARKVLAIPDHAAVAATWSRWLDGELRLPSGTDLSHDR